MSIDCRIEKVDRPVAVAHPRTADAEINPLELIALDQVDETHRDWVSAFHVATLPHGLFPRLGRRFVARWHRAHMASPHGVGYVAFRDGLPVGFALGSTDRAANVDWLLAHRRSTLVLAALPALLRRPRIALDFVRTRAGAYTRRLLRPGDRSASASRGVGAGAVAVLEAVAVTPEARGQGIGSRLVSLVLTDAARTGADRVELVTKDGESGAAGFYVRGAWEQVGRHRDRDGDGVLRFRIDPRHAPTP